MIEHKQIDYKNYKTWPINHVGGYNLSIDHKLKLNSTKLNLK